MLPSAAAFVDPLFSTGFALTLLGIHRIGSAIREAWGTDQFENLIAMHGARTLEEADVAAELVGASYAAFPRFPVFVGLASFYLVAVSFAEICYRLGDPERAGGFLAYRDSRFIEGFISCRDLARSDDLDLPDFLNRVKTAIEPRNIGGFGDPAMQNWYPVDFDALVDGAHKLGRTEAEIERFLVESGMAAYR